MPRHSNTQVQDGIRYTGSAQPKADFHSLIHVHLRHGQKLGEQLPQQSRSASGGWEQGNCQRTKSVLHRLEQSRNAAQLPPLKLI